MSARLLFLLLLLLSPLLLWYRHSNKGHPYPTHRTASTSPRAASRDTVGQLIRALLDTTSHRDAAPVPRPSLQAGADTRAFYGSAPVAAWTQDSGRITADARALLTLLADAPDYGLSAAAYKTDYLAALRDSLSRPVSPSRIALQAQFEVYLTDAVLRFMRDLHRGRLRPCTASPQEVATGQPLQPATILRQGKHLGQVRAAVLRCQPTHRAYRQLQAALAQWRRLPTPPDSVVQHRAYYEQIALNLERWRWDTLPETEYLLINLPAFELGAICADSVVRRHRVIVGKPQTPTPTLSSTIRSFTLAPDWHVPRSIATKEILPRLKGDAGYLARNNYVLYDAQGHPLDPYRINWQQVTAQNFAYTIRQSAGCDNALGNIVFRFANPYSVYPHDTPMRQFFEQPQRAFSHGCMRLEHPLDLAAYLLRRGGQSMRLPSEDECARQAQPRPVTLHRPIALYVRYSTCAAENGRLRFYPDIYHRDAALRRALFSAAATLPGNPAAMRQ